MIVLLQLFGRLKNYDSMGNNVKVSFFIFDRSLWSNMSNFPMGMHPFARWEKYLPYIQKHCPAKETIG